MYSHIKSINQKLQEFSWDHYTYINQFFGDLEVRDIIENCFPRHYLSFEHYDDPEFGFHHYVVDSRYEDPICSIGAGVQDTDINVNDNMCSTYSLLAYFKIPFSDNSYTNQMKMISLCYKILKNKNFRAAIEAAILTDPEETKRWKSYKRVKRSIRNNGRTYYVNMNPDVFWKNVKSVLHKWTEYGHIYFIGDGKYYRD